MNTENQVPDNAQAFFDGEDNLDLFDVHDSTPYVPGSYVDSRTPEEIAQWHKETDEWCENGGYEAHVADQSEQLWYAPASCFEELVNELHQSQCFQDAIECDVFYSHFTNDDNQPAYSIIVSVWHRSDLTHHCFPIDVSAAVVELAKERITPPVNPRKYALGEYSLEDVIGGLNGLDHISASCAC